MRVQNKISLLLALVILTIALFAISSNLISGVENDTYLTPIPWSTLSEYHQKRPIRTKFEAVLEANSMMQSSRLQFTQEKPVVVSVEKMNLANAIKLIDHTDERPGDIEVWLVVFKGSWQILPPEGTLLPLESGCIYMIFDVYEFGYSHFSARSCLSLP